MRSLNRFLGLAAVGFAAAGAVTSGVARADVPAAPATAVRNHPVFGRVVSATFPPDNSPATITVAVHRPEAVNKSFPIAPGAPIEFIADGAGKPATPAALTSGARVALILNQGVVERIGILPQRTTATTGFYYNTANSYRYYRPYGNVASWGRGPWYGYGRWNWSRGGKRVSFHHAHRSGGKNVVVHHVAGAHHSAHRTRATSVSHKGRSGHKASVVKHTHSSGRIHTASHKGGRTHAHTASHHGSRTHAHTASHHGGRAHVHTASHHAAHAGHHTAAHHASHAAHHGGGKRK